MASDADRIAAELFKLEASGAIVETVEESLNEVDDARVLLAVADKCVPSIRLSEALYRRGLMLGAPDETLRGFLALSMIFAGDLQGAAELVVGSARDSNDEVLLSAWANLDLEPGEVTRRLVEAVRRCPESLRLRRQLATYALRIRRMDLARSTHLWLLAHEVTYAERERVAQVIREFGWSGPDKT